MSPSADDPASLAHRSFLDCLQDFYRLTGRELPYFESDPGSPLTFEASVGEVGFSIGYDPAAGEAAVFIYCRLGPLPDDETETVLRRMLALNIAHSRDHNAAYCIDTTTDEAVYYVRRNPLQLDAASLRDELVRIAGHAELWRGNPAPSEPEEEPGNDDGTATSAPWLAFA